MSLLYLLEKIRNPVLDQLMLLVTSLGEETAFLIIALIVFWCVDKRKGYYIMTVGFLGTLSSQFLKLTCRIPRPWVLDENFTIVEQAREAASGYSFPSGHSQTAVGTFGSLAYTSKKRWIKIACVAVMALVPFSRMYLGVHTPADVLVGSVLALVLLVGLQPVVFSEKKGAMKILLAAMIALATAYLLYVELWQFPADIDASNMESALKNAYTLFGCLIGVSIVYVVDQKRDFPVKARWWVQIIKVAVGLALVLLVKEGLRAPLEAFLPVLVARAARYFLVVIMAGVLWPMSFGKLSELGNNEEQK